MKNKTRTVSLSVVIPVYNEFDNLDLLQHELMASLEPLSIPYEIVYVNDGSSDGSRQKLIEVSSAYREVMVVDLRRNFGQTAAIAAGLDYSTGDVIILMDSDLQNVPADISSLLAKLDEGYDVVS